MSDGFLGLDIGTSGVKAVVIDARGAVKASLTTPMALSTPQPGWAEQRPQEWWAAAVASLRRATRAAGRTRAAAVGLSGQMHSSVFLDGRGSVIRPALLWCDGRTSAECRDIVAFLLQSNKFPPGQTDLGPDAAALKAIALSREKP